MNQDQIVQDRIRKVVAVLIILMMLFGLRLIEIQAIRAQEYVEKVDIELNKSATLLAPRGAIFDKETHRLIGAGITGVNAGELIAETVLAIEMGADAHDLGLSIHPHPTLSETVCFAAEVKEGTITDLYIKKR